MSGIVEPAELTLVSLAPERAVRLLPARRSAATRSVAACAIGLHRGAVDRLPRPRCDRQPAGLPARRAIRRTGPLRGRDRPVRATNRLVWPSAAAARPQSPRSTGGRGRRAADASRDPSTASDPGGTARSGWSAVVPRVPAGAGRSGHDRRSGTPLLRPRGPGLGRCRRRRPMPLIDDPGGRRRHGRGAGRRHPRRRSGRRPGATQRSPASGSGDRSSRPSSTRRRTRSRWPTPRTRPVPSEPSAIAPETLVLAASDEVPLLIAHGVPGARRRAGPGSVHGRPARGDPGDRVGDGRRPQPRWRARLVSAPEGAAIFAVALARSGSAVSSC